MEELKDLYAALSKAQALFDHAIKDTKNDFFKSKYATLAGSIDAAKEQLAANGLCVIQTTSVIDGEIMLTTTLGHSSGQSISSVYPIRPVKQDPQGFGSALTYARRYCFQAITGIAADDDDGNNASKPKTKNEATQTLNDVLNKIEESMTDNFSWIDAKDFSKDEINIIRSATATRRAELKRAGIIKHDIVER